MKAVFEDILIEGMLAAVQTSRWSAKAFPPSPGHTARWHFTDCLILKCSQVTEFLSKEGIAAICSISERGA